MVTKYYVDGVGNYKGGYVGAHGIDVSALTEVPSPPDHADQIWDGSAWGNIPVMPKIKSLAQAEAKEKDVLNINYKTDLVTSLYAKREYTFGAVTNVKWYSDVNLTDLVLNVDVAYNYDALGFAVNRTTTRTWYMDDGSAYAPQKVTYKDYTINPQDQLDEAILRRTNILRQCNVNLIGIVPVLTAADPNFADATQAQIKQDGIDFFELYELETSQYKSVGSQTLKILYAT